MFSVTGASRRLLPLSLLITLLFASSVVSAADLRISLPLLPPMVESRNKGPLVQLAQAISREWKEGKVTILGPVPFEQSVNNVVSGKADVHFPLIASPARLEDELPFIYSSISLYDTPFALYSRKGNAAINRQQLTIAALSKLKIETDRAHTSLFYFQLAEADDIESSLKRVSSGEIDGFLFSVSATDPVLKRLKLENIVRTPYRRFKSMMVLQKGEAGEALDEKLSLIIDHLKDTGEYQRIVAPIVGTPAGN